MKLLFVLAGLSLALAGCQGSSDGVAKILPMTWELVADDMCKPSEKHVRLRYGAAPTRHEDMCSARLAEELTKKNAKALQATFLVYKSSKTFSLCDIDGVFQGVRLPKGGCRLPDGWDQGNGMSGIDGNDVPHPIFQ